MNNIKIVGYSERGAMNALFYGIALNKDEKAANEAMNEFLHMAGERETFQDFELYSEFSLSGFGDPDLVITAKNELGKTIVFFIEAKASAGGYYELDEQKNTMKILRGSYEIQQKSYLKLVHSTQRKVSFVEAWSEQ